MTKPVPMKKRGEREAKRDGECRDVIGAGMEDVGEGV